LCGGVAPLFDVGVSPGANTCAVFGMSEIDVVGSLGDDARVRYA
jgi:hypothetical protein